MTERELSIQEAILYNLRSSHHREGDLPFIYYYAQHVLCRLLSVVVTTILPNNRLL